MFRAMTAGRDLSSAKRHVGDAGSEVISPGGHGVHDADRVAQAFRVKTFSIQTDGNDVFNSGTFFLSDRPSDRDIERPSEQHSERGRRRKSPILVSDSPILVSESRIQASESRTLASKA